MRKKDMVGSKKVNMLEIEKRIERKLVRIKYYLDMLYACIHSLKWTSLLYIVKINEKLKEK